MMACALCFAFLQLKMPVFIYQRDLMSTEPWRWWTAQWVHVGWWHYILNNLALACWPFIFPGIQRAQLLWALVIVSPLLSVGLYLCCPQIHAYAGLSGVLHGLYAWAALKALTAPSTNKIALQTDASKRNFSERGFAAVVLVGVILKVLTEKITGYASTEALIGAPVLIEAHQIGVVIGVLYFAVPYLWFKFYSRNDKAA